ncbi:lysozyme inhibitor LprI family protein [Aurantimonas endophytica]|uniref:Uncharacterized protein YecT (DUF1311 family) n=1 Tax=Aurantimonas endophytica TaxID=1522175 RepID=A0A7W6MPQ8_9HYPH|nr:lysozyme inhibitor LprI family protein [Aurantimonas endophytica]MBB4003200.1 uncharacterized protein YecT (DUF1311 family) [Aurantimonas endophytica]MCO6404065.1 DUF1311 domain-containing protein [Aurantimonas endophytica]
MRLLVPLIILLQLPALPAHAEAESDAEYDACVERADTVMPDYGECGGAFLEREDARLNQIWHAVMESIGEISKEPLRDEQRAWLAFRDKTCLFYLNEMEYGQNGRYLLYYACRAAVIHSRIDALEDIRATTAPQ